MDKSIEAFIMGLEIYNKPTIKYRIEGFSFFICNAWELMLKAELLNRGETIYYPDNQERTISLEKTIEKIYTNNKDPLRKNLTRIIHLRNISTHFITQDYEKIYAPLFQACVTNFSEQINNFHDIKLTDFIAQNFLVLGVRTSELSDEIIKQRYSKETAERLLREKNEVEWEISQENERYAIPVESYIYLTKNKKEADLLVGVQKNAETKINVVRDVKNPNNLYPHTQQKVMNLVNRNLRAANIEIKNNTGKNIFNSYDFQLFNQFYEIKSDPKFSFYFEIANRYSYSQRLVDFIVDEIKKDPFGLLPKLKKSVKK